MHLQDGRCGWCRESLEDWEAHHINGFASGGETTIKNLSLLCVACHRKVTGMSVKLREGQKRLKSLLESKPELKRAVCQFPTGYGKTLCIALAYSIRRMQQETCDRLMVVVANDSQLTQAMHSIPRALKSIGAGCGGVRKFVDEPHLRKSWSNGDFEVLVTTIQMVHSCYLKQQDESRGIDNLKMLLTRHSWMIAADEFHHYGEGMAWGESLRQLIDHYGCTFQLALSATPVRDGSQSIFGSVTESLRITYREAIEEKAVKSLNRRKYEYKLKMTDGREMLASDIKEAVAQYGDFSAYEVKESLRYDADYCAPLIREPAERLIRQRAETGLRTQMLVRALTCNHAKYLAESLRIHFRGLSVDWIGGGPNGRDDSINKAVIAKFKPDDKSEPTLDVLVQVGMASEGFDSVLVTQIVDFALVTLEGNANQTKQFIGRGSRAIPGFEHLPCYVNIGTDHPIASAPWSLNDWIDSGDFVELPDNDDDRQDDRDWLESWEYVPSSVVAEDQVESVQLHHIDEESSSFKRFVANYERECEQLFDMTNPVVRERMKRAYLDIATEVNEPLREEGLREQYRTAVENEKNSLARLVVRQKQREGLLRRDNYSVDVGEMRKRISSRLIEEFGGSKNEMTARQLQHQFERLKEWAALVNDGGLLQWA